MQEINIYAYQTGDHATGPITYISIINNAHIYTKNNEHVVDRFPHDACQNIELTMQINSNAITPFVNLHKYASKPSNRNRRDNKINQCGGERSCGG